VAKDPIPPANPERCLRGIHRVSGEGHGYFFDK
jgi:hypothetical protein